MYHVVARVINVTKMAASHLENGVKTTINQVPSNPT